MPSTRSLRRHGLAVAAIGAAVAGCGAGGHPATAAGAPAAACSKTVSAELANVASRIYGQEVHGRDVAGAVARVEHSAALAAAVSRNDPAATRAALRPLLRADIRHIEITRGGRVLASFGSGPSLGPVHGSIRGGGRFTLATGTDAGVASLIQSLTGAEVVMRSGQRVVMSTLPSNATTTGYTRASLPAEAFPSGALRIELLIPAVDPSLCGSSRAQTVANTVGAIGRRLFAAEASGPRTRHVLHIVARDPRFIRAVEDRDAAAVRAQIVRFFQDPHLHVVRIRALDAQGRLINDVGGPYVLAPASTAVVSHGKRVGTVTLSIQDDTGYIKLMHRFTGADVVLRTARGEVPGSDHTVPGTTFSFDATAFPSGALHISLTPN